MTWWQIAGITVAAIVMIAAAIVAGLESMWRARERRDGLR
jgi:hypothetical protein